MRRYGKTILRDWADVPVKVDAQAGLQEAAPKFARKARMAQEASGLVNLCRGPSFEQLSDRFLWCKLFI